MSGPNPIRFAPRSVRFLSATQACRHLLQSARTAAGRFIPLTPADLTCQLAREGFCLSERDTEALLRELALSGEVDEIDVAAGFRWTGQVA